MATQGTSFRSTALNRHIVNQEMDKYLTPINMYIDLSKVFDTIYHNILMDKLKHYGIKGTARNLFKNYLSNLHTIYNTI